MILLDEPMFSFPEFQAVCIWRFYSVITSLLLYSFSNRSVERWLVLLPYIKKGTSSIPSVLCFSSPVQSSGPKRLMVHSAGTAHRTGVGLHSHVAQCLVSMRLCNGLGS